MSNMLQETSEQLLRVINDAKAKFAGVSQEDWDAKPSAEVWSKKEILGHLIDSAANNHLRFVRAQMVEDTFRSPAYEQDFYVSRQHYQEMPVSDIIELWYAYNRQLATVIQYVDPEKLGITCCIGEYEPVTLSFVITDYVAHMIHHLEDILS